MELQKGSVKFRWRKEDRYVFQNIHGDVFLRHSIYLLVGVITTGRSVRKRRVVKACMFNANV
jgi:hypothetical protein